MDDGVPIRRRTARADNPAGAAIVWGFLFAALAAGAALWVSQYAPVFGYPFAHIGQPHSPARMATIPMHLFAFCGGAGALGFVVGLASRRGPRFAVFLLAVLGAGAGVGSFYVVRHKLTEANKDKQVDPERKGHPMLAP